MSDTEKTATPNMEDNDNEEMKEVELDVEQDDEDNETMVLSEMEDEDDNEEEEDEENEEDENSVELMTPNEKELPDIEKQDLVMYHPKIKQHNYEEILARVSVQRDAEGNIDDPYHRTIPILTRYEQARILGARAKQLNHGAEPLTSVPSNMIDGYQIAELELKERVIPFIIRRPLPNGESEYWRVSDLEQIDY